MKSRESLYNALAIYQYFSSTLNKILPVRMLSFRRPIPFALPYMSSSCAFGFCASMLPGPTELFDDAIDFFRT